MRVADFEKLEHGAVYTKIDVEKLLEELNRVISE
jgi:hypothetical protein